MMLSVSKLYSICDGLINEYGAVSDTKISRGNQSTWRKPAPVPLGPSQIPWPGIKSGSAWWEASV
jgi:hypothetical protein